MKREKNSVYVSIFGMSILIIMQVIVMGIIQPYGKEQFDLNHKDSMFIVILCYGSALYGMISILLITFLRKSLER